MLIDDIRRGISQQKETDRNFGIICIEITIISGLIGYHFRSWWVFGGVFFGLGVMLGIRKIALVLMALLTLAWGVIAFFIGGALGGIPAAIVSIFIGLAAGAAVHLSGLRGLSDDIKNYNDYAQDAGLVKGDIEHPDSDYTYIEMKRFEKKKP